MSIKVEELTQAIIKDSVEEGCSAQNRKKKASDDQVTLLLTAVNTVLH